MIAPWVILLGAGAGLLTALRHRTAGRALAAMTGIAVLVSLYIVTWTVMDKWWLGYMGIGNPAPPVEKCDFTPQACDSFYATATAEAPHPPWLP